MVCTGFRGKQEGLRGGGGGRRGPGVFSHICSKLHSQNFRMGARLTQWDDETFQPSEISHAEHRTIVTIIRKGYRTGQLDLRTGPSRTCGTLTSQDGAQ